MQDFAKAPDERPLFEALTAQMPPEMAYTAIQVIRDMASVNVVAQLGAKIDSLRWMMGLLIAVVVALLIAVLARDREPAPMPVPVPVVVQQPAAPPAPEPAPAGAPEAAPGG